MTVSIRKAGDKLAKEAKKVLRPPRAVTAAEAQTIQPARESTKTTMMPWRGWFSRFLKENLPEKYYTQLRNFVFFMPDDIYDGFPTAIPNRKIPISKTDPTITHMYRYPSPGSQVPPSLPQFEEGEDPYDSGYFKRDTKRRYLSSEYKDPKLEQLRLEFMDPDDPDVQAAKAKLEEGPESSPGNDGKFATGPTDFDPTGLRATMSVTWKEANKSLDQHMPDHLPTPTWVGHEEEIIEFRRSRDLPDPIGAMCDSIKVPVHRRVAQW